MLAGNMDGLPKEPDSIVHPQIGDITRTAAIKVQSSEQKELLDKSTELSPKPDISGLCDVLHLPVGSR